MFANHIQFKSIFFR